MVDEEFDKKEVHLETKNWIRVPKIGILVSTILLSELGLGGAGHSHSPSPSPTLLTSTQNQSGDGGFQKFSFGMDLAIAKGWKDPQSTATGTSAHAHSEANFDDTELNSYFNYMMNPKLGISLSAGYLATAGAQDPAIGPIYNTQIGSVLWSNSLSLAAPVSKSSREQSRWATANAMTAGILTTGRFTSSLALLYAYAFYKDKSGNIESQPNNSTLTSNGHGINPNIFSPKLPAVGHDDHSPQKQRTGLNIRTDYTMTKAIKLGAGYNLSQNTYHYNPTAYEAEAVLGRIGYVKSDYEISFSVGMKEEAQTIKTPSQGYSKLGITLTM